MKKRYYSIDILKFVMAIAVVAIHTQPLINIVDTIWSRFFNAFIYLAVPCFFLITGYFLGIKLEREDSRLVIDTIIKKYVKLYISLNVIYLPLAIYGYIVNDFSVGLVIVDYIRGLFFVGEHYNSWILWYILACIYALAFIKIMINKKASQKVIVILFICIFAISITKFSRGYISFNNEINFIYHNLCRIFYSGRLATGIFYINLGIYLSNKNIENKNNKKFYYVIFILSLCIEAFSLESGYVYELARVAASVALFCIVLSFQPEENKRRDKVCRILRMCSMHIYYSHLYIWSIICIVLQTNIYGVLAFVATIIISTIGSLIYIKLSNIKPRKEDKQNVII